VKTNKTKFMILICLTIHSFINIIIYYRIFLFNFDAS